MPKGVMLTHGNFTAMLASLAPVFPLGEGDRMLSILPLHHTFEFTCGLLLPLMLGARIVYVRELTSEGDLILAFGGVRARSAERERGRRRRR